MIASYEFHPACLLMPLMQADEFSSLRKSVLQGFRSRHPILLCDGMILDGRHRYQACVEENIEPIFVQWEGGDPYDFVRKEHEARRSWLSQIQKSIVLLKLLKASDAWKFTEEKIQNEANLARSAAAKEQHAVSNPRAGESKLIMVVPLMVGTPGPHANGREKNEVVAPQPAGTQNRDRNVTATARATAIGVNRGAVDKAETILRHSQELAEQVANGEVKPTEALRRIRNVQKVERIKALPEGQYHVIYADPPWQYNDSRQVENFEQTAAEHHYPTVSLADLKLLDVKKLAAPDSVLFCFATFPLLVDALDLVKSWGFAYKTAFIWDKGKGAFGHYHNASAELLLIATRGSGTPQTGKREDQVQDFPREEHSRKPVAWRELIDRLYPVGSRIELFRRGNAPDGWDVWGAESE